MRGAAGRISRLNQETHREHYARIIPAMAPIKSTHQGKAQSPRTINTSAANINRVTGNGFVISSPFALPQGTCHQAILHWRKTGTCQGGLVPGCRPWLARQSAPPTEVASSDQTP